MERRHWMIAGMVQGVGFRAWAQYKARSAGLRGWTRNRSDGTVEIEAAGPPAVLDTFEALLRRGPRHATVATLTPLPPLATPLPDDFEIRH